MNLRVPGSKIVGASKKSWSELRKDEGGSSNLGPKAATTPVESEFAFFETTFRDSEISKGPTHNISKRGRGYHVSAGIF